VINCFYVNRASHAVKHDKFSIHIGEERNAPSLVRD
jgi:hypothetical protein